MLLKKSMLMGSAFAALILPAIASADLVTHNYTSEYSTVRVTSSKDHYCSVGGPHGMFHKLTAPNGGVSNTSAAEARTICQATTGYCEADMYASPDCSGSPVAHLKINLLTLQISQPIQILNSHYAVSASGSTVAINYA